MSDLTKSRWNVYVHVEQAYSPMPPHGYLASSPQAPPYMWGVQVLKFFLHKTIIYVLIINAYVYLQHIMPPYGAPHPYLAMYPHGGMYAHPSMPPVFLSPFCKFCSNFFYLKRGLMLKVKMYCDFYTGIISLWSICNALSKRCC